MFLLTIGPSQNNPSRDREVVAKQLVEYIGSLKSNGSKKQYIVIMGDFNVVKDNPHAINEVLLSNSDELIDVETKVPSD